MRRLSHQVYSALMVQRQKGAEKKEKEEQKVIINLVCRIRSRAPQRKKLHFTTSGVGEKNVELIIPIRARMLTATCAIYSKA